jgi:hypothetical protein
MDKLCHLGEEIYSLSCNKLFGDTIEDLERQEEEEKTKINDAGQLKAMLFQEFIKGIQNGKISNNESFDSFLRKHAKEFDKFKNKNEDTSSWGQVLGRVPDGNEFIEEVNYPDRIPWIDEHSW